MKRNSALIWILLFFLPATPFVRAQDQLPRHTAPHVRLKRSKEMGEYRSTPDTVSFHVHFPKVFKATGDNRIEDYSGALLPVMERLSALRSEASEDTLRIVHIGDSHVRGRIFPQTVGIKLNEFFTTVVYEDMGVNGATCLTFTHPARITEIAGLNPDLLILSFGTNESHNRRYSSNAHYNQLDELIRLLRARMPDTPILLTTPPGSYESFRQRKRQRTYTVNPRTALAADVIRRYAVDHKLALWDMYTFAGGKEHAGKNWWNADLMRRDHVHYTPEGYVLQGELLFEAFIKTYNHYVSH